MRGRPLLVVVAGTLALAACSGDGSKAAPPTTPTASHIGTAATSPVIPSVVTTTIPGAGSPATSSAPGGTVALLPTTTIPLTAPSTNAAESTAPTATADNGPPTSDPVPGATTTVPSTSPGPDADGDPVTFCAAIDKVLPLYFVTLIFGDSGERAATVYEVAVAPALAGPVHDAAASAPSVVAAPFQRWADRTSVATAAFEAAGATTATVASFASSYGAQVDAATNAGGGQSPPDPVEAAATAGVDANRLTAAATTFANTNGTYETFSAALGHDLTLTAAALDQLAARYPCASDLGSFVP